VREFSIQSTVVDHYRLYRKHAKNRGLSLKFCLLKALEGVLHQWWKLSLTELVFVETSTQTYSLSEEGFGYNYGRLKSSASHASHENTLLRCGKIRKCRLGLQRRFVDGWTEVISTAFSSTACRRPTVGGAGGKANRLLGVANIQWRTDYKQCVHHINGYKEIALYFS